MSIENQLTQIKTKADLHKLVDELPDGVKGVLLFDTPDAEDDKMCFVRYKEIGGITIAETLYLLETYRWRLMEDVCPRRE